MRRKRRSRGNWFPIVPTELDGFSGIGFSWFDTTLTIPHPEVPPVVGATAVRALPLTMDITDEVDQPDPSRVSLRDYVQGQDWLCKRVVGNWWFNHPSGSSEIVDRSLACLALAVLPVSSTDQDVPAIPAEEYNPLFARNAQQPWLWRRCIQLSNGWQEYGPVKSTEVGREGCTLDTKGVMRRIMKEHRLFIIAAVSVLDAGASSPELNETVYQWGYDLRIFGQMKPGKNSSSF